MSRLPVRQNTSEKTRVAGNPNDDASGPARCAVTIRGADTKNNNDFTLNQADDSNVQDERVLETVDSRRTTNAGRHCIRASPFATSADGSPRGDDDGGKQSNKHSIRASPFAVASEPATATTKETNAHGDEDRC